jgi:hypothetical protein
LVYVADSIDIVAKLAVWFTSEKRRAEEACLINNSSLAPFSLLLHFLLEGNILEMSDDGKEIFNAYRRYKKKGMNVLFSLPKTDSEFSKRMYYQES